MVSTIEWAKALGVHVEETFSKPEPYDYSIERSVRDIAIRAVILQGVVAVAYQVEPEPVIEWFHEQEIWDAVTPKEKKFLLLSTRPTEECNRYRAHQEAEWCLLWMINKIDVLGLPTHYCDTRKLVDEIIPALGSDIEPFIQSAVLQRPEILWAEDDRTYDMWCYYRRDYREGKPIPDDLNDTVLYERRYAFEWLDGIQEWDDVTCDS
jgi:hypothetical protein